MPPQELIREWKISKDITTQDLDQRQEVTLEFKETTTAHEEVQHKKKVTNKQTS